jgi:hypothetical protein
MENPLPEQFPMNPGGGST